MEQGLMQQLIDLVTKSAPELWRIGKLQVQITNTRDFVISLSFLFVIAVIFILMGKLRDENTLRGEWNDKLGRYDRLEKDKRYIYVDDDYIVPIKVVGWIVNGILLIIIICNLVSITMKLSNPEYYALQQILYLVKPQ